MNSFSNTEILQTVQALEDRWVELLGPSGATAAKSLLEVAAKSQESARQAANLLLDLFQQHGALPALQQRLQLEGVTKGVRLYTPPPGQAAPLAVPGIIYVCPIPGCGVTWQLQVAGQTIPYCSRHPEHRLVPK